MKGFLKFCLFFAVAVVIWSCFSSPDIDIVYGHDNYGIVDGFWAGILAPFIVALVVIGAIFIVFGIMAAVFISLVIAGFSLLFVGLSMFWPIALALILFYWLFSDPKQKAV